MKISHTVFVVLAVIGSLAGCKKDPEVDPVETMPPVHETGPGTVTEVGQPEGIPVSKTIGPEGGTLVTADGKVHLVIPAGAVSQATIITIQPITNHSPNGIGQAFRFSPDGLQFKKPATLTFEYTNDVVSANDKDGLKIAYQGTDKIWYNVPGVQVDPQHKRISVPMPHFSDWSAYEIAYLESFEILTNDKRHRSNYLQYGESLNLFVWEIAGEVDEPLYKVAMDKVGDVKSVKWSVAGVGEVKANPETSQAATYTAPKQGTLPKQVTISAELTFTRSPKKLILLKTIYINANFVEITFQSETRVYTDVSLDSSSPGLWYLTAGNHEDDYLSLAIYGNAAGKFSFGNPLKSETGISAGHYNQGKYAYRTHFACVGDIERGIQIMPGSVVVEEFIKGKLARGTFSGSLMKDDPEVDCPTESYSITGRFYLTPED
ncbi:hypothetical protein GCM10027347_10250 [Larkinella harenae]